MHLDEINKERKKLEIKLAKLNEKAVKKTSKTAVICESNAANGKGCGAGFYIKDLKYIQTHWYENPHGCTGGDNWLQGEGNFICPKCGHRNRFLNRQDIEGMKFSFGSIKDEYEDN